MTHKEGLTRFSIVVPYRNSESHIAACIESVRSQIYTEWELLLINDASTDRSPIICKTLSQQLGEKARCLHCDGVGPLFARRVGYKAASGDVVISLDSDDMLHPNALMRLHELFVAHDIDMIIFDSSRKADFSSSDALSPFSESRLFVREGKLPCIQKACNSYALNSMCTKAVKRKYIDLTSDYSKWTGLKFAEDLLQTLPILDAVQTIYYLHEPLYFYRVNYDSSTKRFDPLQLEMRDAVNIVHRKYAEHWESLYDDNSLLEGVLTLGLSSYSDMAQGACERSLYSKAAPFIRRLASRPEFEVYLSANRLSHLRPDIRIILRLLRNGHYRSIWILSRTKAFFRKLLGR